MRPFSVLTLALFVTGCASTTPVRKPNDVPSSTSLDAPSSTEPEIPAAELPDASKRTKVPGFDGATAWLNVDRPLSLDDLRGRVVVVDFWTSCCINCLHTLPTLRALEKRFVGKPFVVLGVHSPKFTVEQEADRLRSISTAYDIHHPIVVDGKMSIWKSWRVHSWPTVAILDVEGRVVWADSGEPDLNEMAGIIQGALNEGKANKTLAKGPPAGIREPEAVTSPLAFPGKVIALTDGSLAIADTNHHRIVITDANGNVRDVIGSGLVGKVDGAFAQASFHKPQGLSQQGDTIYVADTENHLVRVIDRKTKTVSTIAGTGELGQGSIDPDERPARSVGIRSPWDVLALGDRLYVALAGSHQIAAIDLKKNVISRFAGSGKERRIDGPPGSAAFAQPSGLATDGKSLFVLDSETSSVRSIDLKTALTKTIVGEDLFIFGDVDGDAKSTRLQHPIGISYAAGSLYVADSYNSKIKRIDATTGESKTFAGGKGKLAEPAGLAVLADGSLLVADTNASRLAKVTSDGTIQPFSLIGLSAPTAGVSLSTSENDTDDTSPIVSFTWKITPNRTSPVKLAWHLPEGTAINDEAPVRLSWSKASSPVSIPGETRTLGREATRSLDLTLTAGASGESKLEGLLSLVICDAVTHKVCVPIRRRLRASVMVAEGGTVSDAIVELPAAKLPREDQSDGFSNTREKRSRTFSEESVDLSLWNSGNTAWNATS